jgi:hypothetical protein
MPVLQVDNLRFTFLPNIAAELYDKWQYYANVSGQQQKAVDVVAVENPAAPTTAWLIEAKDFRSPYPPMPSRIGSLAQTVAMKVEHTLRGLEDAVTNATVDSEKRMQPWPWQLQQSAWYCIWNRTSARTQLCFQQDSPRASSRS